MQPPGVRTLAIFISPDSPYKALNPALCASARPSGLASSDPGASVVAEAGRTGAAQPGCRMPQGATTRAGSKEVEAGYHHDPAGTRLHLTDLLYAKITGKRIAD